MKLSAVLLIVSVLGVPLFLAAQSPRFAISTHATSINTGDRIPGVGATLAYTPSRRFALESTLNFFPGDPRNDLGQSPGPALLGGWRSGNILQGQFGLRANLLQTKRADIFLVAKPGFVSYSRLRHRFQPGIGGIGIGVEETADLGRQTYFAPFFGAGTQVYPTQHVFFRFDAGATLIRYSGFTTTLNLGGSGIGTMPLIQYPGATTHTFQFSTGFGVRFGGRH